MGFCPACWGISLCVQRVLPVPWSGFDLINAFNAWKRSEDAGRIFVAAPDGTIIKQTTGLSWRQEVSAQVFEEAAVDLGHALAAYGRARTGTRGNRRVGFPKRKRKGRCRDSFRLRNKRQKGGGHLIRVGDGHPRTVTLPRIGTVRVHDDTRRLRRLLRPVEQVHPETGERTLVSRARILYATISRHGTRWYVSLNVQAPNLHPARRHPRSPGAREPCRAPGGDPVTGSRPSVGCPVSTSASPTCAEATYTRSRASSPRPTPSWCSRTSMSRDSYATPALPAPSGMPPGPTSVASSATSPRGWMAS
jgi:hypothetical protein